jgi:hypothetical protein
MQLMKENATIAAVYNNKSIAEQNSLDIGTLTHPNRTTRKVRHRVDSCASSHSLLFCLYLVQLGSC